MITANRQAVESGKVIVTTISILFFALCTWVSFARWANFEYRTFDLAYYVQAIWQLNHGRFQVSVENVPLLGNHVEPIVFLFAPLLAVFRHPTVFVVVQNAALATMGPVSYNIAKRLGVDEKRACLLSVALLLTPAAGYIALHEFHPEALAAPLLLLMLQAQVSNSFGRHWLWFIAVLACKENMALLLAAYCAVQCVLQRKRGLTELRKWYLWPMGLAISWFVICSSLITPALNSGNIDYVALYDRLGTSPRNILYNGVTQPHLIGAALFQSLSQGNLVWGILFPFLCIPLLRPRWLLIGAPILLQHLLSWRSSEWTIYFHYAAPLLPLFWMAVVEAIARPSYWGAPAIVRRGIPWLLISACLAAQVWLGPLGRMIATTANWFDGRAERAQKNAFVAQIPATASVVAPLPYLSHLAMREKLYSLHHILKGLKTLSRAAYEPPAPTDFVLIDYLDSATFDPGAGYYHPTMKTVDGRIIPSSDRLLHDFLKQCSWMANSADALTLFKQGERPVTAPPLSSGNVVEIGSHTQLTSINKSGDEFSNRRPLEIRLNWKFQGERDVFPWMLLRVANDTGAASVLTKGLCAPGALTGPHEEIWRITDARPLAPGEYRLEAIFMDNTTRAWLNTTGRAGAPSTLLAKPIPLGRIQVVKENAAP